MSVLQSCLVNCALILRLRRHCSNFPNFLGHLGLGDLWMAPYQFRDSNGTLIIALPEPRGNPAFESLYYYVRRKQSAVRCLLLALAMEAIFDNKTNVLNAHIRAEHDNSIIYSLRTTFGYRGRKDTVLWDENPAPGTAATVGAIHWHDKTLEIFGHKKSCAEVKRHAGRFFNRTRHWRWSADRKEYEILYEQEEWKAMLDHNMCIAGRFSVPFRPHLFSKSQPAHLHLTKTALAEDEVFLILVFVYCEAKRQDKTNSSSGDVGGW